MHDTMITVVGNVVDSPRFVRTKNGSVTNFRLASTARRYDGASQTFVDASTFYIDVECWNEMSSNVSGSVSKGDPVVVLGTISTHEWDSDAGRRSRPQIRALAVGHNLARGTGFFQRKRTDRQGHPAADEIGAGEHEEPVGPAEDENEALLRGRDYIGADDALHQPTDEDLPVEPANA